MTAIETVLNDIKTRHNISATELLRLCIEKRLQESLITYCSSINEAIDYLVKKDEFKMLRHINKLVK